MMKKYFQIGKDYLSKKLQQLDSTTNKIDYVTEQIPNRLKAPLAVLQQEEIDIEDAQAYQNYFKCYPNHHLSHFLLDKYNMMVQGQAEVAKYLPPGGSQSHVPAFDEKIQHKALLFRQAIQEYDQGFSKNDQPIICISVINFHHKRGVEVEYKYPENKESQRLANVVLHYAMPDSSHHKHEDYNFFNFQAQYKGKKRMLFGVSYFKQIKLTEQMRKNNPDFVRSYTQKAVAILSTLPLFGYLKVKLSITTKVFFQKFTNFDIIQEAYKDISKHFLQSWPNMPITDLYIGSDLRAIIPLFQIWKAVLYQKRVVVFGHSSSSVSSFILSLLSLFPGLSTFGVFSKPIAKYMQSLRQLALPLRIFSSENPLSLSFHIEDFKQLDKFKNSNKGNFLLGTTNRLLKQSNNYGIQMLVNLQNCTIQKRPSRRPWQAVSKKQKKFLADLQQMVSRQKSLDYSSSEDCIRNHFHTFLKAALTQIISGIKAFQVFEQQCKQFSIQASKKAEEDVQKVKFFPPLFPEQTKKMIFTELLLQKSFAYFRQFKNQKFPDIVREKIIPSLYINNYDYLLRLSQQQFISYNWIDKKLSFGVGKNNKNFEGKQIKFKGVKDEQGNQLTKSIYVGGTENGKFHKSGCYLDEYQRYQGQFQRGMKEGYGKLVVGDQKYIGDFVHGVFEGNGQLLVGNDIYVGEFKNGAKNGYGSMQGSFKFEGIWDNNYPTISSQEIKAKQQEAKLIEVQRLKKFEQMRNSPSKKQQKHEKAQEQAQVDAKLSPKKVQIQQNTEQKNVEQAPLHQGKLEQVTKQQTSVKKQQKNQQKVEKIQQNTEVPALEVQNTQSEQNKKQAFESVQNSEQQNQKQKQKDSQQQNQNS